MKTLTALFCGAVIALVSTSQQCSAAFSFTLVPQGSTSVLPGGSVSIDVYASDNLAAPNSFFTLTNVVRIDTLNPFNAGITFSNFNPGGGLATAGLGNQIGTITANVSPLAQYGHRELTLDFQGVTGVFGGTLGTTASIMSNTIRITAVPEPTSLALVGLVATSVMFKRRRR